MRKLFIEGLVIFISILASLSVDNMRESSEEKEILNEAVITLGDCLLYTSDAADE